MKKRLFVGYQLSEKLQQEIGEWREKYKYFPVRWTPLSYLHVTLVPPWYEENVDEVVWRLQTIPTTIRQIPITFETINLGPDNARPWLIWAKGQMPDTLLTLQSHLADVLERVERRNLLLHTTLARFTQKQFEQFPDKQFTESITWVDNISSISLIRSYLRRTGVIYETLARVQL